MHVAATGHGSAVGTLAQMPSHLGHMPRRAYCPPCSLTLLLQPKPLNHYMTSASTWTTMHSAVHLHKLRYEPATKLGYIHHILTVHCVQMCNLISCRLSQPATLLPQKLRIYLHNTHAKTSLPHPQVARQISLLNESFGNTQAA